MTKGFSVLMYDAKPPFFFVCLPTDPMVIESHTVITPKIWTAPSLFDPNKLETHSIGEFRKVSLSIKKPIVVGVLERRLTSHIQAMVSAMQE